MSKYISYAELQRKLQEFGITEEIKWTDDWVQLKNESGYPYYIAKKKLYGSNTAFSIYYGNWKTGETNSLLAYGEKELSKQNSKDFEKSIFESSSQIDEWIKKENEDVLPVLEAEWSGANENSDIPEYLKRKGFTENNLMGMKTDPANPQTLLVPLRDVKGKLWNFQKIFFDGSKQFQKSGRVAGVFFTFGQKTAKKAYICEGMMTGYSIWKATGHTVFCAMNCGNILKVAQEIRRKYPAIKIIIAADNDRHNNPNMGVKKANEAARVVSAKVIVPYFEGEPSKAQTDFNDLQLLKGIDEVKKQLSRVEEEEPEYILTLGFDGKNYYYTTYDNKQIAILSDHSESDFLHLAPLSFWENRYGSFSPALGLTVNWKKAKSDLMKSCREKGVINLKKIRGTGAWLDKGKVVLHLGDRLLVGGQEVDMRSFDSEFYYNYEARVEPPHPSPLSTSEVSQLTEIMELLSIQNPSHKKLMAGWMVLAPIGGALPWRPHLCVTGQSGSGKSTILKEFIEPPLNAFQAINVQGATTEAGLRQTIGCKSIPVTFDEFESEDIKAVASRQKILELLRQATSQDSGKIIKGSGSGKALEFQASFMAMLSAINPKIINEADLNRILVVEIIKTNNLENYELLLEKIRMLDLDFWQRFTARSISKISQILKSYPILQKEAAKLHSNRFGQQYGILLAGYHSLISDSVVGEQEAKELVAALSISKEAEAAKVDDQKDCLEHLMHSVIRIGWEEKTIISSLNDYFQIQKAKPSDEELGGIGEALRNNGVYPTQYKNEDAVLICNKVPALTKIYASTHWANGWGVTLKRLNNVLVGWQVQHENRKSPRGVLIRWDDIASGR